MASEWSSRAGHPHPGSSRTVGLGQPLPFGAGLASAKVTQEEGRGPLEPQPRSLRAPGLSASTSRMGVHLGAGTPRPGCPLSVCPHALEDVGPSRHKLSAVCSRGKQREAIKASSCPRRRRPAVSGGRMACV